MYRYTCDSNRFDCLLRNCCSSKVSLLGVCDSQKFHSWQDEEQYEIVDVVDVSSCAPVKGRQNAANKVSFSLVCLSVCLSVCLLKFYKLLAGTLKYVVLNPSVKRLMNR